MTNTAVTIHQGGRRDVEDSPKADRRARSKDLWFPTGSQATGFAEGGGLLQYGPDIRDMFRRAAVKALRHKSWVAYAKNPLLLPTMFSITSAAKIGRASCRERVWSVGEA